MLSLLPLALVSAAGLQWQTDTTVSVDPNARLQLRNNAGQIAVTTWDRNAIRIQADHGSRDQITIDARRNVVTVRAERRFGQGMVDFRLTVPASMSLTLGGVHAEISVDGVRGAVAAESIEGDITVRNVGGTVTLNSIEGDIILDGGSGQVRVNGVDGDIRISRVTGTLTVETIDGDLTLEDVTASAVDASTVDGDVIYTGTIQDGGRYRFASHDGDVTLVVPESINATVSVATFDGDFESSFPVEINRARAGRRFSFVIGSGSAQVELESFDGSIRLRRR